MSINAPKGLALTGSILAIVVGSLALVGAAVLIGGSRQEELVIAGVIVALFAVAAIVLGAIGCAIKPGVILANAIVFSLLTLLGLLGLTMGRPNVLTIVALLLYATTTVFLYIGFPQARRYQAAKREAGSTS